MVGFIVGVASGAIQFWMLSKFAFLLSGGIMNVRTVLFALAQFLFPFAVLLGCAFLIINDLIYAGVGIAATIITCALVRFIRAKKRQN